LGIPSPGGDYPAVPLARFAHRIWVLPVFSRRKLIKAQKMNIVHATAFQFKNLLRDNEPRMDNFITENITKLKCLLFGTAGVFIGKGDCSKFGKVFGQ
jgi:hypothetical protein